MCLVIGVVTVFSLRAFLLDQLDNQLAAASERSRDFAKQNPITLLPYGPRLIPPIEAPGQRDGTVAVRFGPDRQTVTAGRLAPESATSEPLTASQIRSLAAIPADGRFYSRDLAGLGGYRVTASATATGDVVVTGLPLGEVNDTLTTAVVVLVALSLSGLAIAGVAGTAVVRRMLRPLDRMVTTAGEVVELPLDRGEVVLSSRVAETDTDPRTEVGQVGAALNRMLGHIDNALAARHATETRVRQFVADASHELRTPLASIRGYAELAARETETPGELAHAIERIGSEARRMTTLVDDLLLLARLDSGRPLERTAVDLSRLVVDTVSDAQVSGPEHHWKLVLPVEPVIAVGDEARLHQVLANLLANGRSHTPPGTTVVVELAAEPSMAILHVVDDGPGIPAIIQPGVFERFTRGDGSRSRSAGGTGLGLAIVAAVVQAHHGTVQLHSEPGRTAFTITLPAAQSGTCAAA
jgi:two-component system OmpR family sensor kinase